MPDRTAQAPVELTEKANWLDLAAGLGLMMTHCDPMLMARIEAAMRAYERTDSLAVSGNELEHACALAIGRMCSRRNPHVGPIAQQWDELSRAFHANHCTHDACVKARKGHV